MTALDLVASTQKLAYPRGCPHIIVIGEEKESLQRYLLYPGTSGTTPFKAPSPFPNDTFKKISHSSSPFF